VLNAFAKFSQLLYHTVHLNDDDGDDDDNNNRLITNAECTLVNC